MLHRPQRYRLADQAFTRVKSGFTLVELMISIALVLLLVTGINEVFSLTSKTVGAGQASSAAQRDMRAAQKVMQDDFNNALTTNGPCFIIYSRRQWAFRNKQDQLSDHDGNAATKDVQNLGTENQLPAAVYNDRSHRIDMIKFFARGEYHRQTGNAGQIVNSSSGTEAWVTIGHGQVADNTTNLSSNAYIYTPDPYFDPGVGTIATNPNNFYASQWVLTRQAVILKSASASDLAYTKNPASVSPPDLSPLAAVYNALTGTVMPFSTAASNEKVNGTLGAPYPVYSSRTDLANTSIAQFSADVATRVRAMGEATHWYRYDSTLAGDTSDLIYRLQCNPFIQRPITPLAVALTSPQFVSGCSQFIVEFAGDFITQDNVPTSATYGQIIPSGTGGGNLPDGVLDYYVPQTGPNAGTRQIRWYGLPRDVTGSGTIPGATATPLTHGTNDLTNVVPLRDILQVGGYAPNTFEREINTSLTGSPRPAIGLPPRDDYEATNPTGVDETTHTGVGMADADNYLCVWDFGGPQMIRITMTVDDPAGRLNNGATFEYIFTLKK